MKENARRPRAVTTSESRHREAREAARLQLAAAAVTGLLAHGGPREPVSAIAERARQIADATLKKLEGSPL